MILSPNKWELDVQGYLNTCNITATTPRQQIRDFAAGVNALGLWNNMVCWPLRSSQNAGFGSTAYSLGGLGAFDGTLVNAPGWTADGIAFANASSQHITTTYTTDISTADTVIGAVGKLTDAGIRYLVGIGQSGASGRGFELAQGTASSLQAQTFGTVPMAPTINHNATQGSFETYAGLSSNNGTTTTVVFGSSSNFLTNPTHVIVSGAKPFCIGVNGLGAITDRYMQGDIMVAFVMRGAAATLSNYLALRQLIKTTLGQGIAIA